MKSGYSEVAVALARRGNEKVGCLDFHTCCFCQKILSCRAALGRHIEMTHCKTTKLLCDFCPKIYFTKSAILRHLKSIHCKKRFACNICDFKTAQKGCLKGHKLTHAPKVQCHICKKPVTSLKKHLEAHRPKTACPICKEFFHKKAIENHMEKIHNGVKCKKCQWTSDNFEKLRRY